MAELTREQLEALGLTEEQIEAIMNTLYANNAVTPPFPIAKVNYDAELASLGVWVINPIKDDEGNVISYEKVLPNPVRMRFLKSFFQYSKFDAELNKSVVISNIFEMSQIKSAYDLKTGVAISQLKAEDDGIKLQRISLIEFIDDNDEKYYAIAYIKGAYLFGLNSILQKYQAEGHLSRIFTIHNKKEKKGAVTYFVPECKNVENYDILTSVKEDAEKISQFVKWAKQYNEFYMSNQVDKAVEEVEKALGEKEKVLEVEEGDLDFADNTDLPF